MKITEQQLQTLRSLHCERLSCSEGNLRLIDQFFNSKGEGLVNTLQNEAYSEDEDNVTAFYLVKHENGDILFFFSLKCGLLYDQFFDTRQLALIKELTKKLDEMMSDESIHPDEMELVMAVREKLRTRKGITKADLERLPKRGSTIFEDLEKELNDNISRVGQTFSGIELSHFCANELTDSLWDSFGFPQKRGSIIFWQFVVPIVQRIVQLVGCQYLFLFAADVSEDEKLVNHYIDDMNFRIPDDLATTKPVYDFACKFMCQEVKLLESGRQAFLDNFNPDEV